MNVQSHAIFEDLQVAMPTHTDDRTPIWTWEELVLEMNRSPENRALRSGNIFWGGCPATGFCAAELVNKAEAARTLLFAVGVCRCFGILRCWNYVERSWRHQQAVPVATP